MCHVSCIVFGVKYLSPGDVQGKDIIEVGSYDFNGSLRSIIELWNPRTYIGVDIVAGPGVDLICNAENLMEKFQNNSFDIVISTELLEHVKDFRKVISNLKNICKPDGLIIITTRSEGFGYHGFPFDFWRYSLDDMSFLFSDFLIEKLESDNEIPGVFLKARKPLDFNEKDISGLSLFSALRCLVWIV